MVDLPNWNRGYKSTKAHGTWWIMGPTLKHTDGGWTEHHRWFDKDNPRNQWNQQTVIILTTGLRNKRDSYFKKTGKFCLFCCRVGTAGWFEPAMKKSLDRLYQWAKEWQAPCFMRCPFYDWLPRDSVGSSRLPFYWLPRWLPCLCPSGPSDNCSFRPGNGPAAGHCHLGLTTILTIQRAVTFTRSDSEFVKTPLVKFCGDNDLLHMFLKKNEHLYRFLTRIV